MSDIKELVKRLRGYAEVSPGHYGHGQAAESIVVDVHRAADALEALHAECEQWQEAAGQAAVRGEQLEDRCEALEREARAEIEKWKHRAGANFADSCKLAARAESAEAEVARLRKLLEKAMLALYPLVNRVFNDNGDLTVNTSAFGHDFIETGYFVHREIRAALSTEGKVEDRTDG